MKQTDLRDKRDSLETQIFEELLKAHNPELAKIEGGHVTQLWWDGEVTSQKRGSLLNTRNLHSFEPGFSFPGDQIMLNAYNLPKEKFPAGGSIYCTSGDANRIRQMMARYHIIVLALNAGVGVEFLELEDPKRVIADD